ncbi:MAG: hypothetical protein GY807_12240 [Gammaproteobacteria bacterium]|nr:hypothetical protein [Gammaproteobacteria bacterium]
MKSKRGAHAIYSQLPNRAVILNTGDHRVVRDTLSLKYGVEKFACRQDGKNKWQSIHKTTLRDDLLIHLRGERLLSEAQLINLAKRLPPYIGGQAR